MSDNNLLPNFNKDTEPESEDMFLGQKLFWGQPLNRAFIYLKRSKENLDKLVLGFFYFLAVLGWIALMYWFYLKLSSEGSKSIIEILMFWRYQSWLILVFLISLFFDMFIIYRQSEIRAKKEKIKYKKGEDDTDLSVKPLLKNKKDSLDIATVYNDKTIKVIDDAYLLSKKLGQKQMTTKHIFWSLLSDDVIRTIFTRLNIDAEKLISTFKKYLNQEDKNHNNSPISLLTHQVLMGAYLNAVEYKLKAVEPWNILVPLVEKDRIIEEILYDLKIDISKLKNVIEWHYIDQKFRNNKQELRKLARLKPGSAMNKSYTAVATPVLNRFSIDLTLKAKYNKFELCVGREKEISAIFQAWQSGHAGTILVGEHGVGKRTIIEGLAQLMVKEEVPKFLQDKRLLELNVSKLISGASASEASQRLLTCIYEINRAKNIVLFIENIENLSGISSGAEESLELTEVLADALDKGALYFVGSVSRSNYANYIESSALGNILSTVGVAEPGIDQAICMTESKISQIEARYGIYFSYKAISKAVKISDKYIQNKFLPEKAIDLIKKTAGLVYQRCKSAGKNCMCSENDVSKVLSEELGIPFDKISQDETHKLINLEKYIHQRLIGQEEAVSAVANSLRRSRTQVRESDRPIANFLFLGPTGVGKTELAKSVSDIYFGDEKYMIRLDMSEYQHPDSVKKMIGDSDGTLGYLTEAVRKKPFSLVLFDEIEKAHPDILNLFLQMMDDGRLTDGQGRTISFSSSIIIATSNAGALYIQEAVKKEVDISIIKEALIDEHLNKVLRPELINRFDGVIVFKPLSPNNVLAICKLMIKKIGKRLEQKGIYIDYAESGVEKLAQQGYDPKFGARPLRRLLQDKVENEIANLLLQDKIRRRDTVYINSQAKIEVKQGRQL
ncbi:ATP-dependent Clp protease ATP-binding subunit [Patescibacteria group bacterium]|nr:ATP-dependent Clp protease ATP-binding subunit [Patescibacteria group bacterium]